MKKILVILAFLITGFGADAAQRTGGTPARAARTNIPVQQNRSATVSRNATTQRAQTATANNSSARSATVVSRAAKQNVISTGTKVTAAAQNTVVDEKCWNGFMGCMDSFCMLDNVNGGRCTCSDKNAEYDSILAEIQSLDEQSYQMATFGVEQIEMGDAAKAVMDKTNSITKRIETDSAKSKRNSLDLSAWNINEVDFDADVEDIFSLSSDGTGIANKTGDALYRAAAKLCNAQLPECKSQSTMMELMYKQRVRSDCTAYENSLRQQRTQSAQKLATAQSAMREAALEQYRNANKYDLGQCTVQFKQCMQTTGGCGDDFTGCVGSIQEVTTGKLFNKIKQKKIKGTSSSITIAQSTYDMLDAKKELCMTVTQQCVNVRDQVWDTFLREVAPQVKSAELMAESEMRTSCISNISQCFQKACKDNIDPNNPDGSYDMCLTNPSTVEDVCKIQVTPCKNSIPNIMEYVNARLASMRVDSCTREFKECLTSEDRCGKDYTQCVGLDTDTIVNMCPTDKLVACQYKDGTGGTTRDKGEVRANLREIATGIFLNIDNNLLATCQKAVQNKVLEVCGSLSECDAFADDDIIGTDSLVRYTSGNKIIIDGLMNFGLLTFDDTGSTPRFHKSAFAFIDDTSQVDQATAQRIHAAINTVENSAIQKVNILNNDLTIKRCVEGRDDKWRYNGASEGINNFQRFPNLLDSYTRMIFNSALNRATANYHTKYNQLVGEAFENQSDDIKTALCAAMSYQKGSAWCKHYKADPDTGEAICDEYDVNGELKNIFGDNAGDGGLTHSGTRYELHAADLSSKLKTMSEGKGEFIQLNEDGNMIGNISMTSVYSPSTNTCTITTTSILCSDVETAVTENTKTCESVMSPVTAGCNSFNAGGFWYSTTVTTQEYQGEYCSKFGDPQKTKTEIKM